MVGFVISSIVLALLLGFVISWSFILPVREAHGFLTEVATGNFQATINVPNRDEFGVLADRMNQMSRELHSLYENQRAAAQELQRLNARLVEASKAKSEFLANMSHELRTPMNAILGFMEMLLDDIYGEVPPDLREPLIDIQVNGKHLLNLINDVLDLSKIEAGRMELALAEYSVQDVVETVGASLQSLASEKGLTLVAGVQPGIPLAVGDGRRIAQCLMNLAGNALKFTKQGRVEVWVEQKQDLLHYRVSDTGIGIPEDQVEHVFGRVPPGGRRHHAGIRRDRPGFEHHKEVCRNARRPNLGGKCSGKRLDVFFRDSAARRRKERCMSNKTILNVEDNEYNLKIVRQLLSRTSYRLIEAVDGEQGVATAHNELPDLILMDIQLPSFLASRRRASCAPIPRPLIFRSL